MGTVLRNSVVVESAPELVFGYVSDMLNELEWNPNVVSMTRLDQGPIRVGSRYAARWKGSGQSTVEITDYQPPQRWEAEATGRGLDIGFRVEVVPEVAGARLTITMDLRPKGLLKLAGPMIARGMQRTEIGNLAAIKRTIEGRPGRDASSRSTG